MRLVGELVGLVRELVGLVGLVGELVRLVMEQVGLVGELVGLVGELVWLGVNCSPSPQEILSENSDLPVEKCDNVCASRQYSYSQH